MASGNHDQEDELLPVTWPFRAAGTVMIFATVWFCMGWAIQGQENGHTLAGHMTVFWISIFATIALVVLGGVYNFFRERKRRRLLEQH